MSADWPHPSGVVHVASVWRPDAWDDTAPGQVLRIAPGAPRSEGDAFLLSLARARADAILTSGSILRSEPGLRLAAGTHPPAAAALSHWRRAVCGKPDPPVAVVLTRGRSGEVPWDHPVFAEGARVITGDESDPDELADARTRGVRVARLARAGPREAVTHLRERFGYVDLDVELGPGAAAALYEEPCLVDELWLATFREPDLPEALRGGAFASRRELAARWGAPARRVTRSEASGRWSFERFRRPSGGSTTAGGA